MMKKFVVATAVLSLLIGFSSVQAEEISDGMLAQMGLSGMKKMSDEEGTHVRGEGVASVVGLGVSVVNIAPTLVAVDGNSFNASSEIFNALATGASQTNATVSVQVDVGDVTASISVIAATSGSAYAFAR